jgi:gas vesicle protein
MIDERDEREGARSLLVFLAGGLIGAGISLLYAPLSGEKTRQYVSEDPDQKGEKKGSTSN